MVMIVIRRRHKRLWVQVAAMASAAADFGIRIIELTDVLAVDLLGHFHHDAGCRLFGL